MKTYDFDFVEEENNIKKSLIPKEGDNDFKGLGVRVNPLVKYTAINTYFSMKVLLENFGCDVRRTNMFCPFHDDEYSGKPSAKFHEDSGLLYCFSESRNYSAYHALKLLFNADMELKFAEAWNGLDEMAKEKILIDFDGGVDSKSIDDGRFVNPIWGGLNFVHNKFALKEVDFKQHKNALSKIFSMIYQEEVKKSEIIQKLLKGEVD